MSCSKKELSLLARRRCCQARTIVVLGQRDHAHVSSRARCCFKSSSSKFHHRPLLLPRRHRLHQWPISASCASDLNSSTCKLPSRSPAKTLRLSTLMYIRQRRQHIPNEVSSFPTVMCKYLVNGTVTDRSGKKLSSKLSGRLSKSVGRTIPVLILSGSLWALLLKIRYSTERRKIPSRRRNRQVATVMDGFRPKKVAKENRIALASFTSSTMVVTGNAHLQHAARKHTGDQALSPRVASTGLSKPRGKQSKAHQRNKTQRTRPTKKSSKLQGQNNTTSTKGMKGKPNEIKRSKKSTDAIALSPQARPRPNNPKKKLMQSTSPSKPAIPPIAEPSCDDEIRDDQPSLASPQKYDDVVITADANAPKAAQPSTSTSAAVPIDSKKNYAFQFASTLIEEVVDSCTEDIGNIRAVIDSLSPKAIATNNEDSSAHAKKPVPPTFAPPIVEGSVHSHTFTHRRHLTFPAQTSVLRPVVGSSGGHRENDVDPRNKKKTDTEKGDPTITNAQPSILPRAELMPTPPKRSSSSTSKKIPKIFSSLDKRQKGKKKNGNEKSSFNHIKQGDTGDEPSNIAVVPLFQSEIKKNIELHAPKRLSDDHMNPSSGCNLTASAPKEPDRKTPNKSTHQKEDINLDVFDKAYPPTTMMDTKNRAPTQNAVNIDTNQDDLPQKYSSPETTSKTDVCDDEQDKGYKEEDTAQRKLLPVMDTKPKALPLKMLIPLSPSKTLSAIKANSKKRHVSFSPSIDANETAKKSVKASCSFSVPQDFEDLVEKLLCRADEALCVCSFAEYVEDILESKDTNSIHADDLSESSEETSAEASAEASADAILRADNQASCQTTDKPHDDFGEPRPSNDGTATAGDISQKLDDISSSKGKDVDDEDEVEEEEESIIPDDLSLTVKPKPRPNDNISGEAAGLPVIDENGAEDYPATTKYSTGSATKFRFAWKNKSKGRGKSSATSIGGSAEGLPSKEASTLPSAYKEADDLSVTKRYRAESNVTLSDSEDTSNVIEEDSKCSSSSSGTESCSEGDFDVEESESGNGNEKKTKAKQYHNVRKRFRMGRSTSRVKSSAMSAACSTDSGSLSSNE